jgi:hypothetical protein
MSGTVAQREIRRYQMSTELPVEESLPTGGDVVATVDIQAKRRLLTVPDAEVALQIGELTFGPALLYAISLKSPGLPKELLSIKWPSTFVEEPSVSPLTWMKSALLAL